jgi:hypothetical protein
MNIIEKQMNPPIIISFQSDNHLVLAGHSVKILWEIENAKKILLNGQNVTGTIEKEFLSTKETKYKIEASNSFGTIEREIFLKVLPIPKIKSFTANKKSKYLRIEIGDTVTLEWTTNNVSEIALKHGGQDVYVSQKNQDQYKVPHTPTQHQEYIYTLIATALDNKTTINPFILSWNVLYAKKLSISSLGEVNRLDGNKLFNPPHTNTSFELTVQNYNNKETKYTTEIIVHSDPELKFKDKKL